MFSKIYSIFKGMENGFLLATQILNGYRMSKPEYAPNFIGEMMSNCWQKEPKDRPTFSQMADVIEKEIESVVGIDYLNLNGTGIENLSYQTNNQSQTNEWSGNC